MVGVGASVGGYEAFAQLLTGLGEETAIAVILVQHLDPTHSSALVPLLSKSTSIPVVEVENGMKLEAGRVYVIPSDRSLTIEKSAFVLEPRTQRMLVDTLFHSLAGHCGHRAVGVVLSGNGSDGVLGLTSIKSEGGITFAQDDSARARSMPQSAIDAGVVDFVLSPAEIAIELRRIASHPYVHQDSEDDASESPDEMPFDLRPVFSLLHRRFEVDFAHYKPGTILRRIRRRMLLKKMGSPEKYVKFLESDPSELELLYHDILIKVTTFFRDPSLFDALREQVFPVLAAKSRKRLPIRVWVPGCSTGEEPYSIAIALLEYLGDAAQEVPIQIFGTDVSDYAIAHARAGYFLPNIEDHVSPERLSRFFSKSDDGYRITRQVRDLCIFARQNVVSDPPFSRLDLVSCRNVLIYFGEVLQRKTFAAFHYALNPGGFLVLGSAETVGRAAGLFEVVDRTHRIHRWKESDTQTGDPWVRAHTAKNENPDSDGDVLHFPQDTEAVSSADTGRAAKSPVPTGWRRFDVPEEAKNLLVERFLPAGVVVNESLEIVQFIGSTGGFLIPAPGAASLSLLKMAAQPLSMELSRAIQLSRSSGALVRRERVPLGSEADSGLADFEVHPLPDPAGNIRFHVISFQRSESLRDEHERSRSSVEEEDVGQPQDLLRLRRELDVTRDYLQAIIEEQEAGNEELRSANEEIQSSNEELQSTNEELETAKEELQSSNEELITLNDELELRNRELGQLADDLTNLLSSIDIPIVMTGSDLRVRRFNAEAGKVLGISSSDIGRGISEIRPALLDCDLSAAISRVVTSLFPYEQDVQDRDGRWQSLRIRPYKTSENRIDGAVITLLDMEEIKRSIARVMEARDYADAIVETVREPLVVLDTQLRIVRANSSFYETFQLDPVTTNRSVILDLDEGSWDIPGVRHLLEDALPADERIYDFEVTSDFPRLGQRTLLLNVRRIQHPERELGLILLAIEDITSRKDAEDALRSSEKRSRRLFETTFEGVHDSVLIADAESGEIQEVNPAFLDLFRYSRDELAGKKAWDLELLAAIGPGFSAFQELKARGYSRHDELACTTKSGAHLTLELVTSMFVVRRREFIQCTVRDVTARKRREQERAQWLAREQRMRIAAEAASESVPTFPSLSGLSILVVENEPDTRLMVARMLENWGCRVTVAASAAVALESLDQDLPDLVITDIAMPEEDGYSLLAKVRSRFEFLPVIALTAHAEISERDDGFTARVTKPVDPIDLANLIASII